MKVVFFVKIVLITFLVNGQKKLTQNASNFLVSDVSIQRMDAFFNLGYKKRMRYIESGINLGLGIEKTFFQYRFSPHIECFSFYNLFQKEKDRKYGFVLGPGVLASATTYKIEHSLNYFDLFLAYQFAVGRKIKFFHQAGYGLLFEYFELNNNKISNVGNNYFVKIGLSYALD